jgi:hypothetical protein
MLNNLVEQCSSKIFRRENCYIYIGHLGRERGAERRLINRKILLYCDRDEDGDHSNGDGILLSKKANNSLIECNSLSERITARLKADVRKVSIVQCYAPKENAEVECKIQFY